MLPHYTAASSWYPCCLGCKWEGRSVAAMAGCWSQVTATASGCLTKWPSYGPVWPFLFKDLYDCVLWGLVGVPVWVYIPHICAWCGRGQERASSPLELELELWVSCLMRFLRMELRSSPRAVRSVNCWGISAAPEFYYHFQRSWNICLVLSSWQKKIFTWNIQKFHCIWHSCVTQTTESCTVTGSQPSCSSWEVTHAFP